MKQPHTSYLVCFTARSGSTLLCEALVNTGLAGRPEEYFLPGSQVRFQTPVWNEWTDLPLADYLGRILEIGTTPNGVFGTKCQIQELYDVVGLLRQTPPYQNMGPSEVIASVFPNPRYIFVTRRDKVRQAISNVRARQTQEWWFRDTSTTGTSGVAPTYNFTMIDQTVQQFVVQEARWAQFFADAAITPFTVVYEDLVLRYEETVRDVLAWLTIAGARSLGLPEPGMKKQADALSEAWVERYLKQKERSIKWRQLAATPFMLRDKSLRQGYLTPALLRRVRSELSLPARLFRHYGG